LDEGGIASQVGGKPLHTATSSLCVPCLYVCGCLRLRDVARIIDSMCGGFLRRLSHWLLPPKASLDHEMEIPLWNQLAFCDRSEFHLPPVARPPQCQPLSGSPLTVAKVLLFGDVRQLHQVAFVHRFCPNWWSNCLSLSAVTFETGSQRSSEVYERLRL
jgi:hypothetical protein